MRGVSTAWIVVWSLPRSGGHNTYLGWGNVQENWLDLLQMCGVRLWYDQPGVLLIRRQKPWHSPSGNLRYAKFVVHNVLSLLVLLRCLYNIYYININIYIYIYTVRPRKKETHKSSKFFWKWFIRKSLHCYKIQFILFLLTPVIRCIGHAWPSTNHFKWWCQNWFVQNSNLRA